MMAICEPKCGGVLRATPGLRQGVPTSSAGRRRGREYPGIGQGHPHRFDIHPVMRVAGSTAPEPGGIAVTSMGKKLRGMIGIFPGPLRHLDEHRPFVAVGQPPQMGTEAGRAGFSDRLKGGVT